MAISNDNEIMDGMSGKIGRLLVFRQRAGKTIVSKRPKRTKAPTPEQVAVNEKFTEAAAYATLALKTPATKAEYRKKASPGQSAYNLALADYFEAPVVKEIITNAYTGLPGSLVKVWAIDDFKVTSVFVTISDSSGALIEDGQALLDAEGKYWVFATLQTNSTLSGTSIMATAKDLPGNTGTKELVLP
jgi:hypothetical protein